MQATFTKGRDKFDRMTVQRADGSVEHVDCPKQRIIPHDMVHYAVESTLLRRGFLGRVRDGESAGFGMQAEAESDGVERLVEVFQGDAWSGGGTPLQEMIDLYQVTCRERACPPLSVTVGDMQAVRECIEQLDRQWQALPVGGSLTVELAP